MVKQYPRVILLIIWLVGAIIDRLWFSLDNSIPAWDQSEYLNGAIKYYQALQQPLWLQGDWWRELWLLSPKVPPLTYLLTTPFLKLWGTGFDAATLLMLLCSAVLLYSVYSLGKLLFSPTTGLLAAVICQLLPGLYIYRLDFLLDYPLTTIVTVSFTALSFWRAKQNYLWAIIWGVSFGLALLLKQPALFFLFIPYIWLLGSSLIQKKWQSLIQLLLGLGVGIVVCFPWYRTNWLLMLTSGKRATIDSAIAEGDPPLNTIAAWTFYLGISPYLLSWVLCIVPLLGFILYWWRSRDISSPGRKNLIWLLIFLVGGYLLSSVNINKDARYILPLLPVLSILLAEGLLAWRGRWGYYVRVGTIVLSTILFLTHIFPLGLAPIRSVFTPGKDNYPYRGEKWPHQEIIQTINKVSPYFHSTLGVLPSTAEINQHNLSFYGAQEKFPVTGRQVGVRKSEVIQDANSLDWFITKTGEQGSVPEAQAIITEIVETSPDFSLQLIQSLPDESILKLYHRQLPIVSVEPITTATSQVKLDNLIIPQTVPSDVPVPVTYEWSGSEQQLKDGIVLITWINIDSPDNQSLWIHDHGLGMGRLRWGDNSGSFKVTERIATFVPSQLTSGNYRPEIIYLNRETGETYPIETPDVTVTIDPNATPIASGELDLPSQLRLAAPGLALGIEGLDPVFALTARINQYDPRLDYLKQVEISLKHRLQKETNLDWYYSLALAAVLQQDVAGALRAIENLIKLEPNNAYHHAYLGFVYLYDWKPQQAIVAIDRAIAINPDIPEFVILRAIANVFRGHFWQAWQDISPHLKN